MMPTQTTTTVDWQIAAAAAVYVELDCDSHLKDCDLAKESGPDATLACAECGRALWLHASRHDTCGYFCWVTERTLTDKQIGQLGTIHNLPDAMRHVCAYALNHFEDFWSREARQQCKNAINSAKREVWKQSLKKAVQT